MLSVNSQIILLSIYKAQKNIKPQFKDSKNNVYFGSNGGSEIVCYIKKQYEENINELLSKDYIRASFFIRNGNSEYFSLYVKPLREYEVF